MFGGQEEADESLVRFRLPIREPPLEALPHSLTGLLVQQSRKVSEAQLEVGARGISPDHVVARGRFVEERVGQRLALLPREGARLGRARGGFAQPEQARELPQLLLGDHRSYRVLSWRSRSGLGLILL